MKFNYEFVEEKEFLKRAQTDCLNCLRRLEDLLRNECDINGQIFLIGSGARNMVTQDSNGDMDFDYNFNVLNGFDYDEKYLKESVMWGYNKIQNEDGLGDVSDSTSSISSGWMWFEDTPQSKFKVDLGIVTKKNNQWYRLIHKKTGNTKTDKYYWVPAPNSRKLSKKVRKIKGLPGKWENVRTEYLRLKNHYLHRNDHNHSSFICYIEAVNNVYNQLFPKRTNKR